MLFLQALVCWRDMCFAKPNYGVIVQGALALPRCDLATNLCRKKGHYENTDLASVNRVVRGVGVATSARCGGIGFRGSWDKHQCGGRFLRATSTIWDVGQCRFLRTLFPSDACHGWLAALHIWALGIYRCR